MPTADELMELARACVANLDISDRRQVPSLEDIEEQCPDEYAELLDVLQEDDVFGLVDLDRQQHILDTIEADLPEGKRGLIEELTDQHIRHAWLLQEAAFHVGLALGLRMAGGARPG
jgi:hypothetical protein